MKLTKVFFVFFLLISSLFVLDQKGFFLAEVAMAGTCEKKVLISPKTKVHLIELYTSEGCSSCPPAEKWINSLRNNKELGKSFFPISFHVDYWDYIGWKDPLAKREYSNRQREYASFWKSSRIYTPGFVKNGYEWRGLAVRSLPKKSNLKIGVLKATPIGKDKFKVNFSNKVQGLRINYARLGNGIESKVTNGENKGRLLKQYFAVLEYKKENFINDMEIVIPKTDIKANEEMVAIWLDDPSTMKSVQAVGGCL